MSPLRITDDGLTVALKVTPRAGRNAISGLSLDADGTARVGVSVTDVPEGGKANKAVIKLLAGTWGLRKSDLSILRGETDRRKLLLINGDAAQLEASIKQRIEALK